MITLTEEIYTNFTTKNAELYHHGIEGQKWGIRNGPPYPLDGDSRKERKAARKAEKEAKKEEKKRRDISNVGSMTDKELSDAILRTQQEITYGNMQKQLRDLQLGKTNVAFRNAVRDGFSSTIQSSLARVGTDVLSNILSTAMAPGIKYASEKYTTWATNKLHNKDNTDKS